MISQFKTIASTAVCILGMSGVASANEDLKEILDSVMPYMHHSCESVLNTYGEDVDEIESIVRLMTMVSLYNRDIVVSKAVPEKSKREQLLNAYAEKLRNACADDPDTLLAGAVDTTVKHTYGALN